MGSSYTKMAMFGFLFSALVTGVMSSNISSCYKVDQSWTNSTLLDVLTSVPDYEECQALCRDKAGCEGWTWTDEENSALRNHCFLYSDFGRTFSYPHCVSGPPSCLCSKPEQCEITEDNELDVVPSVVEEFLCQEMCAANAGCGYYTWYDDAEPFLANVCVLLSSCPKKDFCSSCHSAPVPCSQPI